jgi:hypothetical protein
VSSALATALEANSSHFRWVAAVSGSQNAASLELATGGAPVMAIGGFNNQGGNLTLAQFKAYVASGDIHYYLASSGGPGGGASAVGGGFSGRGGPPAGARPGSGGGAPGASGAPLAGARPSGATGTGAGPGGDGPGGAGPGGAGGSQSAITAWVKAHYKSVTIGGQTVYDLTQPLA